MIFEASGSVPTANREVKTLPQRRLNGERNSVRVFSVLWWLFLDIRIHHREEEKEMIDYTIKKLVNNARRNRRVARQCYKNGLTGIANWHEGKAEAFMTSARMVKHDR